MKSDIIIIGGGLSGLTAGIALAANGKKVIIMAAGQSSLHYHSGSFDLLGYDANGAPVDNPLQAIANLDAAHPYSKLKDVEALCNEAATLIADAGIKVKGDAHHNHYRLTPMGVFKPTWLTMDEYATVPSPKEMPFHKVLLVNISGFLDFPTRFVEEGLEKAGVQVIEKTAVIEALQQRRQSPSEMRSPNVARILNEDNTLQLLSDTINRAAGESEVVLLPAIVGLGADDTIDRLRALTTLPLFVVATLPPSVPGVRVQRLLRARFEALGGVFLNGATVEEGIMEDHRVKGLKVSTMPDEDFSARHYILASGSFQSHGLVADYQKVYEPVFNLDVAYDAERPQWTRHNVYDRQPYMEYGVKTDSLLRALKDGATVDNLYVAGSVLSGHNAVKQADATGVDLLTALSVAKEILK